jgi:tRNA dimethylallyltransferase
MEAKRVLCVVGPTASGKTKLSILLAERYNGEVVSIDSMQIYRGMSIGTAAPTAAEMGRVPHHMVAVAEPGDNWSAARFTAAADDCIQDILERNKLPVLAGGTGLYLEAVVSGRTFAPGASGGAVRRELELELEAGGIEPLLAQLRAVDPAAAGRLHPADTKRILRALEVYRETGETISRHNEESRRMPDKYDALYIGLAFRDREDMRKLIDRRVDEMLAGGLLEEVRALRDGGTPRSATAMQAIGYKELLPVLDGERTLEQAAEEIKLRSRQYAKRQLTWLRRNPRIHWVYWEKERNFAAALQIATEIITAQGLQ